MFRSLSDLSVADFKIVPYQQFFNSRGIRAQNLWGQSGASAGLLLLQKKTFSSGHIFRYSDQLCAGNKTKYPKKPSHLKGRHDGTDGDAVDFHQLRRHSRYLARFPPITRVILHCHSLHTTTNNSKQTSLQPQQKNHHFLVLYTSALHCARRDC
jgi:hypothetical protein